MPLNEIEWQTLNKFRSHSEQGNSVETSDSSILETSLYVTLRAMQSIRNARIFPDQLEVNYKPDSSPVTNFDIAIEQQARNDFQKRLPELNFLGEEFGGTLKPNDINIAMDPIDGTQNFISHAQNNAIALAILKGRETILGIVANPATGEIAYAQNDDPTRLIQLDMFGQQDQGRNLPSIQPSRAQKILVDLQPRKGKNEVQSMLHEAWKEGTISHLKGTAGSPALGLMETAKGHYLYINPWSETPSSPFDLAPGVKLVQNAGGFIAGMKDPIGHQGTFVAGVNKEHTKALYNITKTEEL